MKKMNFDNEGKDNDEPLIDLLKVALTETPTEAFSERVLAQFLVEKSVKKEAQRPLLIPVIIMVLLATFLLIPMFSMESTALTSYILASEFSEFLATMLTGINLWYVFSPILLALAIILLFQLIGRQINRLIH